MTCEGEFDNIKNINEYKLLKQKFVHTFGGLATFFIEKIPKTKTRLPGTTFSHKYLSQNKVICLGISPCGIPSGNSWSLRTWKSTHLHLSGMMKYGSKGHFGLPACSLNKKDLL